MPPYTWIRVNCTKKGAFDLKSLGPLKNVQNQKRFIFRPKSIHVRTKLIMSLDCPLNKTVLHLMHEVRGSHRIQGPQNMSGLCDHTKSVI
jgi:hypothetical protein